MADAIFCDTTARISKTFIATLAPPCGTLDDFFETLEQDAGVTFHEDQERAWFIKGDWPAVNKAYYILAGHKDDTTDLTTDAKWELPRRQNSDTSRTTAPHKTLPPTRGSSDETDTVVAVDVNRRIKTKKEENKDTRNIKLDVKKKKKKPNVSLEKKLLKAKAKASDLRRELMIDKPLFSVDEIIKKIVDDPFRTVTDHDYASYNTDEASYDEKEVDEVKGEISFSEEDVVENEDNEKDDRPIVKKAKRVRLPKARHVQNDTARKSSSKPNKRKSKPKKVMLDRQLESYISSLGENVTKEEIHDSDYEDNFDMGAEMNFEDFKKKQTSRGKSNARQTTPIRSNQCVKCRKLFSSISNLYRHMKIAHHGHRYQCPDCDKRFTCKESLQRHRRVVHQELRCKICFVIFRSIEEQTAHLCSGSKYEPATCPECGKTYSCASNLNKHIKVAHRGLSFPCELCDKHYKSRESLNEHQRSVHRVFKCLVHGCLEVHDNEEAYAEHIVGVHDGEHDADDKVKLAKEKVVIKVTRKRLAAKCEQCGKTFSSMSNLGKHMKVVHEKIRHHCDKCPRSFTGKEQLGRHYKVVHEGITFPCCFCTEQFANRHSLAKHQQIVHKQLVMDSSFQCEICGKAFLYDCNLTRHKRRDHEGLRFECPICNREFKSKQRLQEHDRVEHQGHRYMCEQCPKMFRNKHKLKEHVISAHTTLKPHNCPRCDSTFARRSALSYHIQKGHDRLPSGPLPPQPIKKENPEMKNTEPIVTAGNCSVFSLDNYQQTAQQHQSQVFMQHIAPEFSVVDKQPVTITLGQESGSLPTHQVHRPEKPQDSATTNSVHIQLEVQAQHTLANMASFTQPQQLITIQTQLQQQQGQQQIPQQSPQQQQQQQQQNQQEPSRSMHLPSSVLQQMQPGSNIGTLEPTFTLQPTPGSLVDPPPAQTLSFLPQNTLPSSSFSTVDINHAISQALAQFPQTSYVYPDGSSFFNTGPQQPLPVHLQPQDQQPQRGSESQTKDIN